MPAATVDGAPGARCPLGGASFAAGPKGNLRGGPSPVYVGSGWDLYPSVLRDGASFVMWWSVEGVIHRAVASSLDGPWHAATNVAANTRDQVFAKSGAGFDSAAVDAPSVLRVGDTFYMYYVGVAGPGQARIGVASSTSGMAWTRMNGGAPILSPIGAGTQVVDGPSAFYSDGMFYLAFSDASAPGSTLVPGETETTGTFLVRSPDPTFPVQKRESLTASGWVSGDARTFAIVKARGGDISYVPELGRLVFLEANILDGVHLARMTPPVRLRHGGT